MMTLADLQSGFCRSVTMDAGDELLGLIAGGVFDPSARLSIYRNNVVARLTKTLSAAYTVVSQLVDPGFFAYAAGEFIGKHLPESGCLSTYGVTFPAFLAEFPPAAELKYLPDVANLEWAIHDIRSATACSPVPITALAAMRGDPAQFNLRVSPAARFIASPYPIDRIWIAHQADGNWDTTQPQKINSSELDNNGKIASGSIRKTLFLKIQKPGEPDQLGAMKAWMEQGAAHV